MTENVARLRALARQTTDAQGEPLWLLGLADAKQAASELGWSLREVEIAALQAHVLPARYQRNLGTMGWEGQLALLRACVGVLGAGGLGGWVVEGLARMGVGRLIVIDSDVFEENNLNRQILATEASLGQPKVEVARQRVAEVNSAVEVVAHRVRANEALMVELLRGSDVIVDALDALPTRLELQRAANALGCPLVHGAIAGFVGQVMTILPGDAGLRGLYGEGHVPERGVEVQWGNPAATPMLVAAWQVQEAVKLITHKGQPLRNRLLFMDSESGTVDVLQV
jgi:molybdopterin/thiamine biosynthesis adenylyltransferase